MSCRDTLLQIVHETLQTMERELKLLVEFALHYVKKTLLLLVEIQKYIIAISWQRFNDNI